MDTDLRDVSGEPVQVGGAWEAVVYGWPAIVNEDGSVVSFRPDRTNPQEAA